MLLSPLRRHTVFVHAPALATLALLDGAALPDLLSVCRKKREIHSPGSHAVLPSSPKETQ